MIAVSPERSPLLGNHNKSLSFDSSNVPGNSSLSGDESEKLVVDSSVSKNSSVVSEHSVVEIISPLDASDLNPQVSCFQKISQAFKTYQPQIIFAMLLLIQITGIYPMDQLIRSGLDIQQIASTNSNLNTSLSISYPAGIIQKAVIAVSFFFTEIVLFAAFLRVTTLNGLANDYMFIEKKKEENPETKLLEIAKNLTPANLKLFIAYAVVALVGLGISSYQLALDAEQFSWKAEPNLNNSANGAADEMVSTISIPEHNFLIFIEIALLSFRHLACALDGVYRSWGNKFAIVHSMGSASMLMDKIALFMKEKSKTNEALAS